MSINRKELDAILAGDLVLNCPKVRLIPEDTGGRPAYAGAGSLSIREGYFELKFYYSQDIPAKEVFECLNWRSGEVIERKYYYALKAFDLQGRPWETKGILLDRNTGPSGAVIVGKAAELTCESYYDTSSKRNHTKLYFAGRINVPFNTCVEMEERVGGKLRKKTLNRRVAKFQACDIEFEVEHESGWTLLSAVSDKTLFTDIILNRIADAFQFVTGETTGWSVRVLRNGKKGQTQLRATRHHRKTRVHPPVAIAGAASSKSVWKLFADFLSYTLRNSTDSIDPVSDLVKSVYEAGRSSLKVEALSLSVSIESLLKQEFSPFCENDPHIDTNIKVALDLIGSADVIDESFKGRLTGAINAMKDPRAKDILFWLRDRGLIESELVSTYDRLRNKSAHGDRVDWAKVQDYINECASVLVLFYHLIFLLIGYTGEYTDYGTYGYSTKTFNARII